MQNTEWSFWRNEAKLSVSDPETRMKAILGVGGAATAMFLAGLFGDAIKLNDASRAAALCIGAVLFPAYLTIEMFYKGNKHGKILKESADRLTAASENSAERIKASKALTQAKDDLRAVAEWARTAAPVSGRQDELHKQIAAFIAIFKKHVKDCIEESDRRTGGVSGMTLDTERLDDLIDPQAIMEYIRRKTNLIDTFLSTLSQAAYANRP
jgi:hypothetical protein